MRTTQDPGTQDVARSEAEPPSSGLSDRAEEAMDAAVEARVDSAVDKAVDKAVEDRVDDAVDEAVEEVLDPLLDREAMREQANATAEQPYGTPGRPLSTRSPFFIGLTAALGVALAYGLVQAVVAVRSVLLLLLVSAFLAIGLDPTVRALERSGLRRSGAVAVVLAGVVLFFTAAGYAVVPPVLTQGGEFVEQVPTYVAQLQAEPRLASLDERFGLLERAQVMLERPERIGEQAVGGLLGVGMALLSGFFSAVTVLILTLYFLAGLPRLKAAAYHLVPRSRRPRVVLLSDEILDRVGGYVAGALVVATVAGLSSFVVLVLLEVPYPLALSVLVGLTALVPLIGAVLAGLALTLVAFFVSVQTAVIVAVYFLLYQQFENYVLYPRVMRRSVAVSPVTTIVAVLLGGSLLGVVGALLAIPTAAAVQLVIQEVALPRQEER